MSTMRQQRSTTSGPDGARLIEHLDALVGVQDLGALALLRRGLSRQLGDTPEMYVHVLPYLPQGVGEREEDAALLVASLYALWHQGKARPGNGKGVNLGNAFRQLADQSDSASIEHRFVALLKASRGRLPDHLRHAIALLKAKEIPLDWDALFRDLCALFRGEETTQRTAQYVRRAWSRAYWGRAGREHTSEEPMDSATDEGGEANDEGNEGEADDDEGDDA